MIALSVVLWIGFASTAAALPGSTALPGYVTNGKVDAMVSAGGALYLGGSFDQIGPRTGGMAQVSASSGGLEQVPGLVGGVEASAPDGAGGIYIGGAFTTVDGTPVGDAVHILSNGALDRNWTPNPDGQVRGLAVAGSTVYLTGDFTSVTDAAGIGRAARSGAAGVDAATGRDTGWNPDPDGSVNAIAASGSTVYLGGGFTSITNASGTGRVNRPHAAAVDAAYGRDTGWNPSPNDRVSTLAVSGSTVYLGGGFTSVTNGSGTGTAARSFAAAVDSTTGFATNWNPSPNGTVTRLVVANGDVFMSGIFASVTNSDGTGTVFRNFTAAVDAIHGYDTGWDPKITSSYVNVLAASGSTVYLGGHYLTVPGSGGSGTASHWYIAAVDTSHGYDTGWDPHANGVVVTVAVNGGHVYLGGQFNSLNTVSRPFAAAVDSNGVPTRWNPRPNGDVRALAVSGSTVYLGGTFTSVADSSGAGTVTRNAAAAVDAANGHDTGWNPNPGDEVDALAVAGSTVYLGGRFGTITGPQGDGTVVRHNAAAVDGVHGWANDWNPNPNDVVGALATSNTRVYLGGLFTTIDNLFGTGTLQRRYAAAVDPATGQDMQWNPLSSATTSPGSGLPVQALVVSGSTVYIAGNFAGVTSADGSGVASRGNIAAVDADSGRDTGWSPNPLPGFFVYDSAVRAIAVSGGTVYFGGVFNRLADDSSANFVAAVEAATGKSLNWHPEPDGPVDAIALRGSTVYLGGEFFSTGAVQQSHLAGFGSPAAEFSAQPVAHVLSLSFTDASSRSASGAALTSWRWDFGDGSTSRDQDPTHAFMTAGRYTVTLAVSDSDGGTSEVRHDVTVAAPAHAAFSYSQMPRTLVVAFRDLSIPAPGTNLTAWMWRFGDGASSAQRSPTHRYPRAGTYAVSLTATDSSGQSAITTRMVSVAAISLRHPRVTLTHITQSARIWQEPRERSSTPRRPRYPVGSTIGFTLNEPANITLTFRRQRAKHRPLPAPSGRRIFAGHRGRNTIRFDGRVTGGKRLGVGTYELVITARAGGPTATSRSLTFTIV